MKYLSEFRNPKLVKRYLNELEQLVANAWTIMEVCGGQTHSLVKHGLLDLMPEGIRMVHGPGCPVCVTPLELIDHAISLALEKEVILCSFGDMLRVPGSRSSLLEAKAEGADVRILYSPLEAVQIARQHPEREIVFFGVGFETTAPANALSIIAAKEQAISNYSVLCSHVLVPPAMKAVIEDPESKIDAFLAAGHVCTVMGISEYHPLVAQYHIPIVVTGFEPVDLLHGIVLTVKQLESGQHQLENQYSRVVRPAGNPKAIEAIQRVFMPTDREWRGIGTIPQSGYAIRPEYAPYDAKLKFRLEGSNRGIESEICIAGQIMKGIKKPADCPAFGTRCQPQHPLGAPMVSSEGACAAYYHYSQLTTST